MWVWYPAAVPKQGRFALGEYLIAPFDAVANGAADFYHGAEYYWVGKSKAYPFFTAVPFGMTATEIMAWTEFGGGQALWDELAALNGEPPSVEQLEALPLLDAVLKERRPRPRWKAPMVEQQQIRWFRTTLLGRTPGWSPPATRGWRPLARRSNIAASPG